MNTNLSQKSLKNTKSLDTKSKALKGKMKTVRSIIKRKSASKSRIHLVESKSNSPNTRNQSLSYDADRSPLSASGIYIQTIEQTDKEELSR